VQDTTEACPEKTETGPKEMKPHEMNFEEISVSTMKMDKVFCFLLLCFFNLHLSGCRSRGPGSIPGAATFSEK
jgi:hypothetical protein